MSQPSQIENLYKGAIDLKDRYFRDLWFKTTKSSSHFSLDCDITTNCIVIRLADVGILHLSSIRLTAADGNKRYFIKTLDDIAVSSNRISADSLEQILNFSRTSISFHTELEDAHLSLHFPESRIVKIEINNREDLNANRAWSMCIDALINSTWHEIYSHRQREAAYEEMLRQDRDSEIDQAVKHEAITVLISALSGSDTFKSDFAKSKSVLGPANHEAMKHALNKFALTRIQREITAHGLQRTFRFWSDAEVAAYASSAKSIMSALESVGYCTFLGFGTLLGFVREGSVIPHDDDIDIMVVVDGEAGDESYHFERMASLLAGSGISLAGDFKAHRHARFEKGKNVDVFLVSQAGDQARLFPARDPMIPVDHLLPTINVDWYGQQFAVPRNPYRLLSQIYGADWRVPNPGFGHQWRRT